MEPISFKSLHNIERTSRRHVEGFLENPEYNIEGIHVDRKISSAAITNAGKASLKIKLDDLQSQEKAENKALKYANENGYSKIVKAGKIGSDYVFKAYSDDNSEPCVIVISGEEPTIHEGEEAKEVLAKAEAKADPKLQKAAQRFADFK